MTHEFIFNWKPVEGTSIIKDLFRPMMDVELKSSSGEWKTFYPEVDSGAPLSVFNESDCDFLGYELTDGTSFDLHSVLGGSVKSYLHEIEMKIGSEILKSRIAFTKGKNHKQLIGRTDVFDYFQICLRGKVLQTSFSKE